LVHLGIKQAANLVLISSCRGARYSGAADRSASIVAVVAAISSSLKLRARESRNFVFEARKRRVAIESGG
jgi:hypothetical protein